MEKYVISCDWFQVTCKRDSKQCLSAGMMFQGTHKTEDGKFLLYSTATAKEYNALFGLSLSVCLHDFVICTIMAEPRVGTLKKSMCLIKVANPLLYCARWCWFLQDVMGALGWKFHNISRLDLCADFNYFSGHLDPREFIRRFLRSGAYNPDEPSYVRVGSNKYTTIGRKDVARQDVGGLSEVCCSHFSEYLRFGSRNSGVCVYLYNKTQELNDKFGKQYIRDCWHKSGLEDSEDCPVFRLELSILPNAMTMKRKLSEDEKIDAGLGKGLVKREVKTFDILRLSMNDLATQQKVEDIFWAYASKYFRFKVVGTQLYKHNWDDICLFDVDFSDQLKPYRVQIPLDSGVAERNAASTMTRLLYLSTNLDMCDKVTLYNAIGILERQGAFKTKQITDETILKIAELLRDGHTWEELGLMNIASIKKLDQVREVIHNAAVKELRDYLCDADVARAIDAYDVTTAQLKELAELNYPEYDTE